MGFCIFSDEGCFDNFAAGVAWWRGGEGCERK
jgi:hypothetical protein